MKYNGAEIIITLLERLGIKKIAGIPGGANLPMYTALHGSSIEHILARHEQGAGFIAQGMARTTGRAAVCFGTSGPGATNLLTALADANMDSIPIIAITGQVPTTLIGTDAFQEVDMVGMSKPAVKAAFLAQSAADLLEIIPRAFEIAESGKPGPVVIDVPKNVQFEEIEVDSWPEYTGPEDNTGNKKTISDEQITRAAELINQAERPVLYIGGGIIHSEASGEVRELAEMGRIPVTTTLMGLGAFPADHPLSIGMLGMHGEKYTNRIVNRADVLIAIGVRFDDRATGKAGEFCKAAKIIHIDIDAKQISKIKEAFIGITGDAKESIARLIPQMKLQDTDTRQRERSNWHQEISDIRDAYPPVDYEKEGSTHPINIIKAIGSLAEEDTIITTDVGQHQMWTAQAYPFKKPGTFLTSGGLGTMGFGLPAAIGAAVQHPNKQIICISGDGSILMNIQELAVMAETQANIKLIILNNKCLGLVRQQQELFFDKKYEGSFFECNPDFGKIAEAFGIKAVMVNNGENPAEKMHEAFSIPGPCVINIPINIEENVTPMVPPGGKNSEMIDCGAKINS